MTSIPPEGERIAVRIVSAAVEIRGVPLYLHADDSKTVYRDIPHLNLELERATDTYGKRLHNYLVRVPIPDLLVPTKSGTRWLWQSGRKLFAAVGLASDLPSTAANLDDAVVEQCCAVLEDLVGKTLSSTVRHIVKEYEDPRFVMDENGVPLRDENGDPRIEAVTEKKTFDYLTSEFEPIT